MEWRPRHMAYQNQHNWMESAEKTGSNGMIYGRPMTRSGFKTAIDNDYDDDEPL